MPSTRRLATEEDNYIVNLGQYMCLFDHSRVTGSIMTGILS